MSEEIKLPEDLDPAIAEVLSQPAYQEVLSKIVAPIVAKKDEILGKLANTNKEIQTLGGFDTIRTKLSAVDTEAAQRQQAEQQAALASNDVTTLKTTYTQQLQAKDQEVNELKAMIMKDQVSRTIDKAFRDNEVDAPELLSHVVASRTKTEIGSDGKVVMTVLKEDGSQMLLDTLEPAGISDLLNELKSHATYSRAFKASNISGSGTTASVTLKGGSGVDNPFAEGPTFSLTKQMELYKRNPALAKQMALKVGKTI